MQHHRVFLDWLHRRKISDKVIEDFGINFATNASLNGECIVIPVYNPDGSFAFNKYRRNPMDQNAPKYTYDRGGKLSLYGANKIKDATSVLVTEGEMDALVAWSFNIPAVSGTGGAMSFAPEWAELLAGKEVILCFDNDHAGGEGMARALSIVPNAKVMFIPDRAGVKDISDYVAGGGDLRELLKTAVSMKDMDDVVENRAKRISVWQSTYFHDAYVKIHTKPIMPERKERISTDRLIRAKEYPIESLLEFKMGKACCLWHSEDSGSMHYYKKTNSVYCFGCGKAGDAIDVYRAIHDCTFREALEKLQ